MKIYWVEGLFISKENLKRAKKSDKDLNKYLEPFMTSIWADSPDLALQEATDKILGGQWVEGPRIARKSEEQRMREMGAPELPGFGASTKKRKV
jgi:hypothetical protein